MSGLPSRNQKPLTERERSWALTIGGALLLVAGAIHLIRSNVGGVVYGLFGICLLAIGLLTWPKRKR